jgi:predicted DNA-binding transcriptional regulator AlpA
MEGNQFEKMMPGPLMTRKNVADFLQLSERTVWARSEPRGTIPVVMIGRSVRYSPSAIQEWMQRQTATFGPKSLTA